MAWTLCTRDDVKKFAPIPEHRLHDLWSDIVEDMIIDHMTVEAIGGSPVTVTDEYHDGDGTNILVVRKPPIQSVTALTIDGSTVDADQYVVFENYIALKGTLIQQALYTPTFPEGDVNVKISYTSGFATVPPRIKMAAISMILAIWNYENRQGADGSLKWADTPVNVGEMNPNTKVGLTSHLYRIMKRTLRRERLRIQ